MGYVEGDIGGVGEGGTDERGDPTGDVGGETYPVGDRCILGDDTGERHCGERGGLDGEDAVSGVLTSVETAEEGDEGAAGDDGCSWLGGL